LNDNNNNGMGIMIPQMSFVTLGPLQAGLVGRLPALTDPCALPSPVNQKRSTVYDSIKSNSRRTRFARLQRRKENQEEARD
jgi:hypothetical protein